MAKFDQVRADTSEVVLPNQVRTYQGLTTSDPSTEPGPKTDQQRAADVMKFGLPGVILAGGSTVAEILPGIDHKTTQNFAEFLGEDFGQFYKENNAGLSIIGDLATTFVPAIGAVKLSRSPAMFNRVRKLFGTKTARRLLPSSHASQRALMESIRRRSQVLAGKGQKSFLPGTDAKLDNLTSTARGLSFSNNLKEGIYADLAVAATMNQSEFLFPEELSLTEHALFFAVPTGLIAGGAWAGTRFKIKDELRRAGSALEEFTNQSGAPMDDVIFRPGTRGTGVSVYGMEANYKRALTQTQAQDETLLTNLKAEINQLDLAAKEQIKNMGTDNIYPGYTSNYTLSEAEVNTITNAWKQDELLTADVFSVEPFDPKNILRPDTNKKKLLESLNKEKLGLMERLKKAKEDELPQIKIDGMEKRIDEINKEVNNLRHSSSYILEPDSSLTRTSQRKVHFGELDEHKITTDSKLVPHGMTGYKATFRQDGKQKSILVRSDFDIAIPEDPDVIQGVNATKILKDPTREAQLPENTRLLLQDIGEDYHVKRDKGRKIYQSLSEEARNDISKWIASPSGTRLRTSGPGDPIVEEIYQAYEPLRARLRELAGANGTIPLLRGEGAQETAKATNDIVSFTADPNIARKFGMHGNVIVKHVSPEDVVAVVGGAGDELEFLVRGNTVRNIIGDSATNATFEALTTVGKTGVYSAGKRAIADFLKTDAKVHITPSAHHAKMDMVLEVMDRRGLDDAVMERINFDGWPMKGLNVDETQSLKESMEYLSLAGKYREFSKQLDLNGAGDTGILKLKPEQRTTMDDIITGLNLPNDGLGGAHPVIEVFSDLYHAGYRELDEAFTSLDDFADAVKKVVGGNPDDDLAATFSFRGTQLKEFADERKPVVMFSRGNSMQPVTRDELISRVFHQRLSQIERLANASQRGAPLVEAIVKDIQNTPEAFTAAKNVSSLIEGTQLRKDRFVQIMSTLDNNPTFVAVDNISDRADKLVLDYTKQVFREHTDTFNKIMSSGHEGDMSSFAMARNALGHGWRVDPRPVPIEEGGKVVGYQYKLLDHDFNKRKWAEIFDGDEMPDEAFMPGPATAKAGFTREPLTVTPLANDTLQSITRLSHKYLDHVNELRVSQGRKPIPKKPMHVPPKRLTEQETVYIIDQNTGKPVSLATGKTQAQAMRQAEQDIEIAKREAIAQGKQPPEYFRATQGDVSAFHQLQDEAFGLIDDFTNPLKQTGPAKGTSFGESIEVGPQVLQDIINTLSRNYNRLGKQVKTTIFEPELRRAEIAKASAGLTQEVLADKRTIWDLYVNRVLGVASNNQSQTIGKLYTQIENTFDHKLQRLWDNHLGVLAGPKRAQAQAAKQFDDLDKKLGKYNPFKDMVDYAENTLNVRTPPTFRKMVGTASEITTLAMLRFMEVGLAVINLISLPALIPSVASALKRRPGQTVDDWKNTIAAWSTPLDDNNALWNPVRAATSGVHFLFNGAERKWMLETAAKKGMLFQEVAERMDLLTSPSQGYLQRMVRDKAKMLSFLVDKSEGMSRTISFSIFYNMGRKNLQLSKEAALAFAHRQANQVIGDFRPNVKPQIFQGAAGMPFGLFTTFAWNYFQRMFSYMERGQFNALMNAMGMQSAMFGASSLPGFNQFVDRFTDNYDGTHNLVDRLQEGFGTEVTDALMYGSVGALTGLAVSTRADIQLPGSNMYNIYSASPTISLLRNTYGMVRDSIKSIQSGDGFNAQRQAEILATQFPIRTIRNIFELGLGESVDRQGRIINENTRDLQSIAGRVSGFKTLSEHKTIMEFSRIRSEQARQSDLREQLRHELRSAFRAGKLEKDTLNTAIENYMLSGGDPENFAQFMRDQAISGLVDKTYLEALSAAADKSRNDNDFVRLMDILNGK